MCCCKAEMSEKNSKSALKFERYDLSRFLCKKNSKFLHENNFLRSTIILDGFDNKFDELAKKKFEACNFFCIVQIANLL